MNLDLKKHVKGSFWHGMTQTYPIILLIYFILQNTPLSIMTNRDQKKASSLKADLRNMFTAKKTAEKYQKTGNYPESFIKCLLSIILIGFFPLTNFAKI